MSDTTETAAQVSDRRSDEDFCALTVVHHPDPSLVGAYQALTGDRYEVGRESSTLFPGLFEHKRVSRAHATLQVEGGDVVVRDRGSRNGTYVNGGPITERKLSRGDTLRIGPVVLLYHRGPRHYDEPASEVFAGTSYTLARLIDMLTAAGASGLPVMLIGETGSGKELAAQLVHDASGRGGAFVPINCGAMADGVMPSELFGHTRGAFSGADVARRGLIDEAHAGTLFLDELGSASPALQATLLRLLENGEYRVVGDSTLRRADVRFVSASHPDIRASVEADFRQDLWYRLAHHVVEIPPLREHPEDIPAIVRRRLSERGNDRELSLTPEHVEALVRHPWPGNVRELLATVDRWAASPDGAWVLPAVLPPADGAPDPKTKRPSREELVDRLTLHRASVSAVARAYGVSRKSVYRWIETHEIDLAALRTEGP